MGDSDNTHIPDANSAQSALGMLRVMAEDMKTKVEQKVAAITAKETGKPWGTAKDYGGRYEAVYYAGEGGGSAFVKKNAALCADELAEGCDLADKALKSAVDLDTNAKNLFSTDKTSGIGKVNDAIQKTQEKQQEG